MHDERPPFHALCVTALEQAETHYRLLLEEPAIGARRYQIALYFRLLDLATAAITLLESHHDGVNIQVRAVIEIYVNVRCLHFDENYLNHMMAARLNEDIKIGKALLRDADQKAKRKAQSKIASWEKMKLKLEKAGYKELRISRRFHKANWQDIYDLIYPALCVDAHSSTRILEERYFTGKGLVREPPSKSDEELGSTRRLAQAVIHSSVLVHARNDRAVEMFVLLLNRLEELRGGSATDG